MLLGYVDVLRRRGVDHGRRE